MSSKVHDLPLPEFAVSVTPGRARIDRWKHNLISWISVPMLPFDAPVSGNSFGVLMYHRVCDSPSKLFPPSYNVSPRRFRNQLKWLLNHGYTAWPLSRLYHARRNGEPIPSNVFAVTFDDGYENNCTTALPILKQLNVPASVFLATRYIDSDQPYPFDNWMNSYRGPTLPDQWRPMSRDQCHQMLDSGLIELGCHTHSHSDFRGRTEAFRQDLGHCHDILTNEFGVSEPAFAYPYGTAEMGFADESLASVVRDVGCSCALQIGNRMVTTDDDLFHWPRFDVASGDTGMSLAAKISGRSQILRGLWRRLRGRDE